MKLAIHIDTIRALLLFAAKADIRYYLNGVLIETGPQGTRAVVTNGHTMAVANLPMLGEQAASLIVPRNALEQAIKAAGKGELIALDFAPGERTPDHPRSVSIEAGSATLKAAEVDGQFPQWRRVIPATVSGDPAQYDPDYLQTIAKAAQLLHGKRAKYPGIAYNGKAAGLSRIGSEFIAVVMPLNTEPETTAPDWVAEAVTPPAEAVTA